MVHAIGVRDHLIPEPGNSNPCSVNITRDSGVRYISRSDMFILGRDIMNTHLHTYISTTITIDHDDNDDDDADDDNNNNYNNTKRLTTAITTNNTTSLQKLRIPLIPDDGIAEAPH